MPEQAEFERRLQSIERLLGKIEEAADPDLRRMVRELTQFVMDLHGAGLERILETLRGTGGEGEKLVEKLSRDDVVASLLVLHGIHPLDMETRVAQGLEEARRRLRAHGGEVELLSIQDGAVRLRLRANGHGCGSTAAALREMVEEAVYGAAPDLAFVTLEGEGDKRDFVALEALQAMVPPRQAANGVSLAAEKGGV